MVWYDIACQCQYRAVWHTGTVPVQYGMSVPGGIANHGYNFLLIAYGFKDIVCQGSYSIIN